MKTGLFRNLKHGSSNSRQDYASEYVTSHKVQDMRDLKEEGETISITGVLQSIQLHKIVI